MGKENERNKDFFLLKEINLRNSSDPSSGLTGLEPAASALTGRCSDQLNYNPSKARSMAYISTYDIDYAESNTDY
jgi:hypothetical protein